MKTDKPKFTYTDHREGTARRARQHGYVRDAKKRSQERQEQEYRDDRQVLAQIRVARLKQ